MIECMEPAKPKPNQIYYNSVCYMNTALEFVIEISFQGLEHLLYIDPFSYQIALDIEGRGNRGKKVTIEPMV